MPPPSNKPGVRFLPKPKWADLVEPYAASTAPTIRDHLKHHPGWLWVSRRGSIMAIPLAPFIERYGLDITLPELTRRMGADSVSIATFGRNGEHRFPPLDRVPEALKGYARVEPGYLPAPMRAESVRG